MPGNRDLPRHFPARHFDKLAIIGMLEHVGHKNYDRLAAWQVKFESNWLNISTIETEPRFDEKFYRMFNYYFLSCKAAFETDHLHLWQLLMNKAGQSAGVHPRVNLLAP